MHANDWPSALGCKRLQLEVPIDVPVLPRSHDLACLLARGRRGQRAKSVPSVGAGHELGVVLDRSIRHHDEARLAVVEYLGAVAALATVVRRDEHIDTLEEAPDMRVLEQCKPTSPFEVASENERDAADVGPYVREERCTDISQRRGADRMKLGYARVCAS